MRTRIYDESGVNRFEMHCIRQIEKSKLMGLLERERRLAGFLAEHYSTQILKNARKSFAPIEEIINQIYAHPEVKEIKNRINNILDAYREFKHLADCIRGRTLSRIREQLLLVSNAVGNPF